jgi:lysophospholipase L1-like esterase
MRAFVSWLFIALFVSLGCAAPVLAPTAILPTATTIANTPPATSAVRPGATAATSTPLPPATGTIAPTGTPLPTGARQPVGTASPAASPPARTIKVMPLGDSITYGWPDISYGGYRRLLGTILTNDGYHIDFVGSVHSGKGVIPDPDNEGHYGWTIPQLKTGIDTKGWLETYQPDIILLHIGTNDLEKPNPASAPGNLSALIDDILARLPRTHVVVAQIIPFRKGPDRAHQAYAAALPGIVASKAPRVSLVDMQTILTPTDYADGIHPNASGYDKMARAWEPAIRAVISAAGLN